MRKISATYIFPCNRPPLKNGILVCDDEGRVVEIIDTGGHLREQSGLEHYSGILVPGFVNAHCHLELSHMKGKISEKRGLGEFLKGIHEFRNSGDSELEEAMEKADIQMQSSGIVAVGDISNSLLSLERKQKSKIGYYTLVEVFGVRPSRAKRAFSFSEMAVEMFRGSGLSASVTPHAPYSVSAALFRKIKKRALKENTTLSIHNQESYDEWLFFKEGSGRIAHHINDILGIDISFRKPTGRGSLEAFLPFIPAKNQLLLIHNTYTCRQDISFIKKHRKMDNTYWVLCPNANLYIENRLPPVPLFRDEKLNICMGTDSMASNHNLSLLSEMLIIQNHFPETSLEELIDWVCINGARALRIDGRYGSFEPGKQPGVNLITGVDLHNLKLTSKSRVKVFQFKDT